jgi:hypothetical protein
VQLVTVRFDRVFDVVHGMHNRKEVTFFGFQYGPKRVFGVRAPGRQNIDVNAVITAYLKKEDDWQTLVGWFNHSTGEVVVESAAYEVFFLILTGAVSVMLLKGGFSPPLLPFLLLLAMFGWSTWCIRSLLLLRRARSELERMKVLPTPTLTFPSSGQPAAATEVKR